MPPFTGLDRECIYFFAMTTSPSWSFSWGDITSLVLPSLVDYELASSIYVTIFGRSLLCPTICLQYHAARSIHHPDTILPDHCPAQPRPFSDDQWSQTAGLQYDWIQSLLITSSAPLLQLGSCVGHTMSSLQVHPLPLALHRHFRHYTLLYRSNIHL